MQPVSTSNAPTPAGHYSQGIVHNGLVYVAGQLPLDPARPGEIPPTIEAQTERTLENVRAILRAAGSDLDRLMQVTVYLPDVSLWPRVNETYARIMAGHRPARAVVPTKELRHGVLIEIQAIAAVAEGTA